MKLHFKLLHFITSLVTLLYYKSRASHLPLPISRFPSPASLHLLLFTFIFHPFSFYLSFPLSLWISEFSTVFHNYYLPALKLHFSMLINLIPILSSDLILAVPKLLRLPAQIPIFHISHFCFSCHQTSFKITSLLDPNTYPALLYITCLLSLLSTHATPFHPPSYIVSYGTNLSRSLLSHPIHSQSILQSCFCPGYPFPSNLFHFPFFRFSFFIFISVISYGTELGTSPLSHFLTSSLSLPQLSHFFHFFHFSLHSLFLLPQGSPLVNGWILLNTRVLPCKWVLHYWIHVTTSTIPFSFFIALFLPPQASSSRGPPCKWMDHCWIQGSPLVNGCSLTEFTWLIQSFSFFTTINQSSWIISWTYSRDKQRKCFSFSYFLSIIPPSVIPL